MNSLIFFGSDQYSTIVLNNLLSSSIVLVVTDRPKPKGKDHLIEPNPVEKLAIKHHLKITYYPDNLEEMSKFITSLPTTKIVGLCASFDHLLPPPLITFFKGNLFNLHPSLLPQYRNVSPVQYAIALGDKETGITLFRITSGIDNGEIIGQVTEPILPTDTTPTLTSRLFFLGSQLFISYLSDHAGSHPAQPTSPLIFTKRLSRDSGFLEWNTLYKLLLNKPIAPTETTNELLQLRLQKHLSGDTPTTILSDLIRALTPWPSVWSTLKTSKGELRLSVLIDPDSPSNFLLHLAGKPQAITLQDFTKYYL
ncbi:MAG: formyltransferase family protein [bacterium]